MTKLTTKRNPVAKQLADSRYGQRVAPCKRPLPERKLISLEDYWRALDGLKEKDGNDDGYAGFGRGRGCQTALNRIFVTEADQKVGGARGDQEVTAIMGCDRVPPVVSRLSGVAPAAAKA